MNKLKALLPILLRLFSTKGMPTSEISAQEKLRWNLNRLLPLLGWPGITAIALMMMCIPFYFSTIRPMQTGLVETQLSLNSLNGPSSSAKVDHSSDAPAEQLAEFYDYFPSERESPHLLGIMVDTANKYNLNLNHGEYSLVRDSVGQLRRFKITLPVKGNYPQIRKYLSVLIAEIPSMSLENVQFERKDVEDLELQAKITLVLYLRLAS